MDLVVEMKNVFAFRYHCLVCSWTTECDLLPERCARCGGEIIDISEDEIADLDTAPCKACGVIHTPLKGHMRPYSSDCAGIAGDCKTAEPIRRTPHIQEQFDILAKFLDMAGETLARLEDRLTPVLSPAPPNTSVGKDGVLPSMSPVARTIGEAHDSVNRLSARMQTLLDRIEL